MFFGGRKEECELCGRKMTDKTHGEQGYMHVLSTFIMQNVLYAKRR